MNETTPQSDESTSATRGRRRGRATGGIILIVLGALFLLRNLYPWFRFSDYWPVILIVLGSVMIWRSRST